MNETYHLEGSNGDVILFDDVQYAILRDSLSGLSGIPVEYDVSYSPGLIGGEVHSSSIIEREVSLHVAVIGNSREEIERRRAQLISALNPTLGESKFFWHKADGSVFYLRVRPASSYPLFESGTNSTPKIWECTIDLICHDPSWYSTQVKSQEFAELTTGFKLPTKIPFTLGNQMSNNDIVNNGTLPTPVEITLHGRLNAPIILTNLTSGKSLTINRDIAANETLTINTAADSTTATVLKDVDMEFDELRKTLRIKSTPEGTSLSIVSNKLIITDVMYNVFNVDAKTLKITPPTPTPKNALYYCSIGSKFWMLNSGMNVINAVFGQVYNGAHGNISYRERYIGL